jgi:membrane protein
MKQTNSESNGSPIKRLGVFWNLLIKTVSESMEDNVFKLAAALSYYTVFSLPPLLIIIIRISGLVYGEDAVSGKIFEQLQAFVGSETAMQIQMAIKHFRTSSDSYLATIIGIVTLVIGATAVFSEIQNSVNLIWKIRTKARKGFIKLLINRLLSFSLIITLSFILVVSLAIDGLIVSLSGFLQPHLPEWSLHSLNLINLGLMFSILTLLFTIIFKVLPDARVGWKSVLGGAIVSSVLFMAGRYLIAWYLSINSSVSAYGAAGSLIILLVWVYYSAVIVYIGAEFSQVYALHRGKRIYPNKYAVFIHTKEVESRTAL